MVPKQRKRGTVRKMKQSTTMEVAMKTSLADGSSSMRVTQAMLAPTEFQIEGDTEEALMSLAEDFHYTRDMVVQPTVGVQ